MLAESFQQSHLKWGVGTWLLCRPAQLTDEGPTKSKGAFKASCCPLNRYSVSSLCLGSPGDLGKEQRDWKTTLTGEGVGTSFLLSRSLGTYTQSSVLGTGCQKPHSSVLPSSLALETQGLPALPA